MYVGIVAPVVLVLGLVVVPAASANEGDDAWDLRAERMDGDVASAVQIEKAILAYRQSYERDPSELEARWKLIRALHFLVDFSNAPAERKNRAAEEAIELAGTEIDSMNSRGGDTLDRAQLYFWSAIAWGVRAQRVGLLTIAREGAATRMQEYAETSRALDINVEQGGALRMLSRLHASLPRVPFLTGWVDRSKALEYAEAAVALDPEHPGNQLVLALAIVDRAPTRLAEARDILQVIANIEPAQHNRAEETAIRKQAYDRLSALEERVK